jgi:regulator of sigma E protease
MSILIFLGVLFVLVLVHELGHFAVAKWTGMRVDEFGIGFPPKLFGIQRGETLYSINLLPLGGFVKIHGEDSVGEDGKTPDDERSFTAKSKKAQSAVLLAGITMNILFAWFLFAVAFGMGVESAVDEAKASPEARLTITSVLPGSPAEKASIAPGSVIKSVSVGGETLSELKPSTFSTFVSSHGDSPVTVAYTYKNELRLANIVPETGIITDKKESRAIGVALTQIDTVHRSFFESVADSFFYTLAGLRDIAFGIFKLLGDAVMMDADFSQVAGPVGIVGLVGEASAYGVTALLMFTAFISLNLAVINVLPFPALDGGRFVMVLIEAVKGSPITPKYAATVNAIGFFVLIALMVVVTWSDIAKLM